jgi:hypothetical protein
VRPEARKAYRTQRQNHCSSVGCVRCVPRVHTRIRFPERLKGRFCFVLA